MFFIGLYKFYITIFHSFLQDLGNCCIIDSRYFIKNMILRKHKKIDLVLIIFGAIALFVVISVSVILYLLFSKYHVQNDISSQVNLQEQEDTLPQISPEELKNNYKKEIEKQIDFVQNANLNTLDLTKQLENNLLQVRVPAEDREKFLDVTLQVVRIQKQSITDDVDTTRQQILQMLQSLLP